jgi:threonine dehydrogenase-like Zn-dependent dehydrogenase
VREVFCTDLSPQRLALMAEFGAVPLETGALPSAIDLALEVTGDSRVIADGVKALRPGGHYIWAGMVHPETKLDLTGEAVLRKCLSVRGVHNYGPHHLAVGLDFLGEIYTRLPLEKLISQPLPLEQLDEGVELARSRQWQRVAIQP